MSALVIGIDPDAKAHGVAVYADGYLTQLQNWTLMELFSAIQSMPREGMVIAIEDVASRSFVYGRNQQRSKAANAKVSNGVGRCQQAQVEVERLAAYLGVEVIKFKPRAGNWAKRKEVFAMATGWTKRSNEDNRSAAFFGYLAQGCVIRKLAEG